MTKFTINKTYTTTTTVTYVVEAYDKLGAFSKIKNGDWITKTMISENDTEPTYSIVD